MHIVSPCAEEDSSVYTLRLGVELLNIGDIHMIKNAKLQKLSSEKAEDFLLVSATLIFTVGVYLLLTHLFINTF